MNAEGTISGLGASPRLVQAPVDMVLGRLDRVKIKGPCSWMASCPTSAHGRGDRSMGLSIKEVDDGRVLLHCFSGCSAPEVVGALGLELSDLFPRREIEYPHHAPKGGFIGRGRIKRIAWPDLFDAIERDLRVCSLAFSDLANGKPFSLQEAEFISGLANHLADEISTVTHG